MQNSDADNEQDKEWTSRLTSGFLNYPSGRHTVLKNPEIWIRGKRVDDDVFPYWRIHDRLYDLTNFQKIHPGGKFWIEITRGTDITEAFESSHFGNVPEKLLEKYFVAETQKPRNSPFTFEPNGFYKTLKERVTPILNEVGRGPSREMLLIQDSLLFGTIFFAILACLKNSTLAAVVAGFLMSLSNNAAHNFFHQKDNWRMYIFDMMFLSSREWRISHALSHHIFPNTIYDYEITALEPHLLLLPISKKTTVYQYTIILSTYIMFVVGSFVNALMRAILIFKKELKLQPVTTLPLLQLLCMCWMSSFGQGLWLWLIVHTVASVSFLQIGLTAGHHHPEIYHEGDAAPKEKDWGIHQVIATRERGQLFMTSLFFASVSFGNHTLHHLFPTVDHSKLPHLLPVFLSTCQEFGIKFQIFTVKKNFKGFISQLASVKPNSQQSKCLT